jgi:hypothetical protein
VLSVLLRFKDYPSGIFKLYLLTIEMFYHWQQNMMLDSAVRKCIHVYMYILYSSDKQ